MPLNIAKTALRPGLCAALVAVVPLAGVTQSETATVTAQVRFVAQGDRSTADRKNAADVVIWLKSVETVTSAGAAPKRQKLTQFHKTFDPHLLVVQVGSVVDFPNRDPFFHNVFSLFEGKRFDLGLYEAGATNSVRFDRAGISFLFCNIHPEMSAVVVAVDTPYYGVSDASGKLTIPNVPDGRYEVHYWSERGVPEALKLLTRTVAISGATHNLAAVEIAENPNFRAEHKNKYGQDYVPPPNADYPHP